MEIERKFLVKNLDFLQGKLYDKVKINQHYLYNQDGIQLRVRVKRTTQGTYGYITAKSNLSEDGLSRNEYEMEVSPKIAKVLFNNGSNFGIYKHRYTFSESIDGKSYTIEVDDFKGMNSGLLIAEIEFKSKEEAKKFNPIDLAYLGKEVTDDPKYKNDYLNKKPYSLW